MLGQLFRLALADLRRDWALSLCHVFMLAAVLTPLLVLFGMQQGVLGQLLDELRRNPVMREIGPRMTGSNRFTGDWLASLRARTDVAFVVADARFNAATVEATSPADPERSPIYATLVPTAADDPLHQAGAWADDAGKNVVVSADAARALGLQTGSAISVLVPRMRDGMNENQSLALMVASILPEALMSGRRAIIASAPLVLGVQHYRDGFAVPELGWAGNGTAPEPPRYERFRLYARSIDDVEPLTEWLRAQGVEPVSHIEDIAPVQILDHGLSIVLLIISAFAAGGLAVAVAAMQWNAVRRKRRELALLALVGYGKGWLLAVPLLQAAMLSTLGIALAIALFEGAGATIDFVFVRWEKLADPACTLDVAWFAMTGAAALLLTLAASAAAVAQILRIEPATVIRDE
jgi:putative ABC transport system permease protein